MTPYLPIAVIDSGGLARLTEGPVKVYVILCRYAKAKTLHAWPSLATVAHLAGISDRAVRKALRVLERAGLIVTRRGIGRSHTSVYKLVENPDPPNPVSEVEKGNHRSGLLGGKGEQGFRVSEAEKGNRGSGFLSGKGEPGFRVSERKRGTTVPPEDSMKRVTGGAAAPPASKTPNNGELVGLFIGLFREKVREPFTGDRGKLAGNLKRLGKLHGPETVEARIRRWFGKDRDDYGPGLFFHKFQSTELRGAGQGAVSGSEAQARKDWNQLESER